MSKLMRMAFTSFVSIRPEEYSTRICTEEFNSEKANENTTPRTQAERREADEESYPLKLRVIIHEEGEVLERDVHLQQPRTHIKGRQHRYAGEH